MAPFDMCYQASALSVTRLSYAVATIDFMLEGGRNWTMFGGSSLVQVNDHTDCFAIVEMGASMPAAANSAKRGRPRAQAHAQRWEVGWIRK
jgi:hypothetical protein